MEREEIFPLRRYKSIVNALKRWMNVLVAPCEKVTIQMDFLQGRINLLFTRPLLLSLAL
jgi:hypothetical protein